MSHWFQRIPPPSNVHTASVLNASRLMFVFAHAMARATYTHTHTHTLSNIRMVHNYAFCLLRYSCVTKTFAKLILVISVH